MAYERVQKSGWHSPIQKKQSQIVPPLIDNQTQADSLPASGVTVSGIPSKAQRDAIRRSLFEKWAGTGQIQTKLTIGEPGDKYEQEADRVASQVVNQINAPAPQQSGQSQPVQRAAIPEEENELMMKPLISTIQREEVPEEEEELQMKPMVQLQASVGGMAATNELETAIQQARGGGQPLADNIREPMEQAFGADFSGVKVHTDAQADQLNQSIQAKAFTTGQDVFFRQGEYDPGSRGGQELIAHELTHVVQQNGGAVQRTLDVATTPKLKGEDYANNVQKLIDMIDQFIANFKGNEDLQEALNTINKNRPLASVDSNEVTGADQNNQAYGNYVKEIENKLNAFEFKETDQSIYNRARRDLVAELNRLFNQLPHIAVDLRVGQVIDLLPRAQKEKKQEKIDAKAKLDRALRSLAAAMTHQIYVLLPKR